MKVAVVVNKFPVVSETFVINHVVSLLEAGLDVTVFSLALPQQKQDIHPQFAAYRLQEHVIYGEAVPFNKIQRLHRFSRLLYKCLFHWNKPGVLKLLNFLKHGKKALDLSLFFNAQPFLFNNQFDIVHCHFGNVGNIVQKVKQAGLLNGKVVVSFHGFEFLQKHILAENNFYRDVFRNCDGIVANSKFTLDRLVKLGCAKEKLVIIPVIPNSQVFVKRQYIPYIEKKTTAFEILSIARLVEKKGIRYAIEAIQLLKTAHNIPVQYTIIGTGPLETELQEMVAQYNLKNEVRFLGAQPQNKIAESLAGIDVFLLPSIVDTKGDTETQGLVLIEAQLMKIPVVATNVGGIPDSVADQESAILVEEKSPVQLAEALLTLYNNKELRHKMGKAGEKFVLDRFNTNSLTQKTICFYKALAR